MKQVQKILLLYKKSVYTNYFVSKKSSLRTSKKSLPTRNVKRIEKVHKEHHEALTLVENSLKAHNLKYTKKTRGSLVDYSKYDLVVTVGGDGTFLEAARNIRGHLIVGVNSSPKFSVGNFCIANAKTFPAVIAKILNGKYRITPIYRLKIKMNHKYSKVFIVNDILVAHMNPAAMSRYDLKIGSVEEEQRSSGVWISTAAGSTGAIYSAGGKILPRSSKKFQYRARELYHGFNKNYRLKGGILSARQKVTITSLMREGMIFVDGARAKWPFPFGCKITVESSSHPLKMISVKPLR